MKQPMRYEITVPTYYRGENAMLEIERMCNRLGATYRIITDNEIGNATMSNVLWCDPGNHAFKAGQPGSQSFQGTTRDEEGNPIRIEMDACSEHSFQSQANSETVKEIGKVHDSD